MTLYVVDPNTLIRAHQDYYDPEFCPAFWEWIQQAIQRGLVGIIEPVANEIESLDPDLWQLLEQLGCAKSIPLDAETIHNTGEVLARLEGDFQYTDAAKQDYADSLYPRLIAYASIHDAKVVTLQKSDQAQRNTIRLPDLCFQLGVTCVDPFEMLRQENARFILEN